MSTRRHLPDGLPDHRARATRRGECSVIANHTPNGTTPNTTSTQRPCRAFSLFPAQFVHQFGVLPQMYRPVSMKIWIAWVIWVISVFYMIWVIYIICMIYMISLI